MTKCSLQHHNSQERAEILNNTGQYLKILWSIFDDIKRYWAMIDNIRQYRSIEINS